MSVKRIDLSWITVSDFAQAKHFFVDILGFKIEVSAEEYSWMELVAPEGGMRLGVAGVQERDNYVKPGTNAIVTMVVDDLEKSVKTFTAQGVTFHGDIIEIPGHVKMIYFTDPDNNKFQLVEVLDNK
jgi:predicted enzyme related to lactoylglutathione lyase